MVKGGVILWSGGLLDIPTGWVLCDGNNGTPNLTDKFVVGAGDNYAVGDAGGVSSHKHAVDFSTGVSQGYPAEGYAVGFGAPPSTHTHRVDGDTETSDNRPPYYSLCYIMKT